MDIGTILSDFIILVFGEYQNACGFGSQSPAISKRTMKGMMAGEGKDGLLCQWIVWSCGINTLVEDLLC